MNVVPEPDASVVPPPEAIHDGQTVEVHEWRPSALIKDAVFEDYVLSLWCTTAGGLRIFAPTRSSMDFLVLAASGGRAILAQQKRLKPVDGLSPDEISFMCQRACHTQEFFGRQIKSAQDLRRKLNNPRTGVLPANLGLDSQGRGKPWSVADLIQEGEEACRALGRTNPQIHEKIRLGFLEAAKRNPLHLAKKETGPLVRMALFAGGPVSDKVNKKILRYVRTQIAEVIAGRLGSLDELNGFLNDQKADLVHRIAKRKRTPVGTLTREQVRNAILDIGWEAFQSVGHCVDAQMRAVCHSLPRPLRGWERQVFELTYFKQPNFGNLPLILLRDRFGFLHEAVQDLLQMPRDRNAIAVIHRLLAYYMETLHERQRDDKEYQQVRAQKNKAGRTAGLMPLRNDETSIRTFARFKEIAKYIALKRSCVPEKFFAGDWEAELESSGENEIQISYTGDDSNFEICLSAAEYTQLATDSQGE